MNIDIGKYATTVTDHYPRHRAIDSRAMEEECKVIDENLFTLGHGSGGQITMRPTRHGQTWFVSLPGAASSH